MNDLLLIAAAAAVVFVVAKKAIPAAGNSGAGPSRLVSEWQGWQYFSDGTAIGPDGTYYKSGSWVWSPQ